MRKPGNEQVENEATVDQGASYYYDDAPGYEVYRDDEPDDDGEPDTEPGGTCEPAV